MLLLGVELRQYARAGASPKDTLQSLTGDLERVTSAIARRRGQVETVSGHRVVARFEGDGRGYRALAVAAEVLDVPEEEDASSNENEGKSLTALLPSYCCCCCLLQASDAAVCLLITALLLLLLLWWFMD